MQIITTVIVVNNNAFQLRKEFVDLLLILLQIFRIRDAKIILFLFSLKLRLLFKGI